MKVGCLNVRSWGVGKFEDLCKELDDWKQDVVDLTETPERSCTDKRE